MKNPERFANQQRIKYPGKSQIIDYGNSPTGAIHAMCRECMCQTDCSSCHDRACWLFPYRPGADAVGSTQRTPGVDVPSQEEYDAMRKALDPDGSKAGAIRERFEAARSARNNSSVQDSIDDDFEGVPV